MVCLGLCWLAAAAFAEPIKDIRIEGVQFTNEQNVREVITTRVGDELTSPAVRLSIRDDVRAIWALGKYSNVETRTEPVDSGAALIFSLQEKPRLADIRFEGNDRLGNNRLLKELGFDEKPKPLVFFDDAAAESYKTKLSDYYTKQSFPNTEITWRAEDGSEPNTKVLVFTITEGEKRPVKEIVFEGNTVLGDKTLKKRMQTKESWWFIIKHEFNESVASDDALRIERTYWDYGYLDAGAELVGAEPMDGGLRVKYKITEGQPYTLGGINVTGNTIFSDEELLSKFTSKPGDTFDAAKIQQDEIEMLNLYRAQGYLDVSAPVLPDQVVKDEANHVATINMTIREAPRKYLGKVDIQGVITMDDGTVVPTQEGEFKTKDFVITRELELTEGEPLDWTAVLESDRNLVNTGFFKTVPYRQAGQLNLAPGFKREKTNDPNVENLLLQLEEEQTGSLSFGGGVSTTYGPSLFASVGERNLFGYGVKGTITGEYGQFRRRAVLNIFEPYLLGSDISADWDIYWIDTQGFGGRTFDENRVGTSVLFSKDLTDEWELLFGFKIEDTDLSPESGSQFDLDPLTIPHQFNLGKNMTTSITVGFQYDTRDFRMDPTDGIYARSTLELAGLTDNEFIKNRNEFNYYYELFDRMVLATSTELQLAYAYGSPGYVPMQERYFVGGSRTVRGFREGGIGESARLWYKDPVLGSFHSYLGGEASHVTNAEMRYSFSEVVQGVVFMDVGAVWPEIGDINPVDYRVSTGLGLRIKIPFANAIIRFDFPFVIRKMDEDETELFHFSFGQTF